MFVSEIAVVNFFLVKLLALNDLKDNGYGLWNHGCFFIAFSSYYYIFNKMCFFRCVAVMHRLSLI